MQQKTRKTWRKLGVVAIVVAGLSWLFLKSVRDTLSEPYDIDEGMLSGWTLLLAEPMPPGPALLALQPPGQIHASLFQQIFRRTMESMTAPGQAVVPVVLQSEYRSGLDAVFTPDEILELAQRARLEHVSFEPVCVGVKREPYGGRSRQLFFVLFEAPPFEQFRKELGRVYEERGGADPFDPAALEPVLPIAATDADFARWWPMLVNREADCQAPLT